MERRHKYPRPPSPPSPPTVVGFYFRTMRRLYSACACIFKSAFIIIINIRYRTDGEQSQTRAKTLLNRCERQKNQQKKDQPMRLSIKDRRKA